MVAGDPVRDGAADVRAAVAAVVDPELRVVTVAELGILRDVVVRGAHVEVTITPTYTGCPAMDVIRQDIAAAARAAGYHDVEVRTVLAPPWTTDWITASGRAKLAAAGIAPPPPVPGATVAVGPVPVSVAAGPVSAPAAAGPVPVRLTVGCPRCGSPRTEELSRFGSTACKALWRCRDCAEPFEAIKAY